MPVGVFALAARDPAPATTRSSPCEFEFVPLWGLDGGKRTWDGRDCGVAGVGEGQAKRKKTSRLRAGVASQIWPLFRL